MTFHRLCSCFFYQQFVFSLLFFLSVLSPSTFILVPLHLIVYFVHILPSSCSLNRFKITLSLDQSVCLCADRPQTDLQDVKLRRDESQLAESYFRRWREFSVAVFVFTRPKYETEKLYLRVARKGSHFRWFQPTRSDVFHSFANIVLDQSSAVFFVLSLVV